MRVLRAWGSGKVLFEQFDQLRCWFGQFLDWIGFGPVETPHRVLLAQRGMTLKSFSRGKDGAPLLLIPAPIKRAYIWDLAPRSSAVRRCLERGVRVYLIQWEQPGERELGLNEYADQFIIECLDAMEAETGQHSAFLAGHSLGGTLAAIFAALHPERVRGLVLFGGPLNFGIDIFAPLIKMAPPLHFFPAISHLVPGTFLDLVSWMSSPKTFMIGPWLDWLDCLADPEAMQTHLRVNRWMLDEMPLPTRLFCEVVELLYRRNAFMDGNLIVRGRHASPENIKAPILAILETSSSIVPPESVFPFLGVAGSVDKGVMWYQGDIGVALQHVGILVGANAQQFLFPSIIEWVKKRDENSDRLRQ